MKRAFALTCALAAGASCGPVAGPPPLPVPTNSCPAHPCSAYAGFDSLTCGDGMCVSNDATFDFTLVVESSFYAPGVSIPIASFRAAASAPSNCNAPPSLQQATCLQVPQVVEPSGLMVVERAVVESVGAAGAYIDTSAGANDGGVAAAQWSLPVHVQYRPLWPPADANASVYVEAASIGLPLSPVDATIAQVGSLFPAPRGSQATEWHAPLAPGLYERDVVPDDDAFPVVTTSPLAVTNSTDSAPIGGVDTESGQGGDSARTFTVTRSGASLSGFTVYLRDATTLRRVSSRTVLDDSAAPITLATIGQALVGGPDPLEVVVAPPDGAPIPYLADPVIVDHLGPNEPFPALYPPVTVSGTIEGPDLTPVQASLVIDSVVASGSTPDGIMTVVPNDPAQPHMHYAMTAQTDANGRYQVALPPGTYDVFVTPSAASNAGSASVTLKVGPPLGALPPIATGKDLQLPPLTILQGIAVIADGRPLAGALVQAQPAVALAAKVDPRRWPRAQTATTDANGAFAMFVDPGTYDVVVQPADGTGFPWTTLSSQTVTAGKTLVLAPMLVPAPLSIDLVLHDPSDNPLIRTLVRAFAPASGATSATPGAPLPVIEIGSWLTDTSGHLTMLLAPPR